MLNISASISLSLSLFCITVIFHHSSQPSISPTPFIILDHLDHGHPPSRLALAFGTNHRVHGRHFSLAPFRWANPQWCFLGSVRWNEFFMYLFSYIGNIYIYTVYKQLNMWTICICTSIKNNQNTFITQHLSVYLSQGKIQQRKHENTPNKNICWSPISPIFTSKFHPGRIQQDNHVFVEVLCWFLSACRANLEVTDRLKRSYKWYHLDQGCIDSSHTKICIWHGSAEIFEDQLWTGRINYLRTWSLSLSNRRAAPNNTNRRRL